VTEQSTVSYVVSSGPDTVTVPDVTGFDKDTAREDLVKLGFVIVGLATTLPPALLGMAVIAGGALLADVVSVTVFQRIVPDEMRGRVIGGMQMLQTFTYAIGSLVLPVAVTAIGAWIVLPIAGVAIAVASVVAVVLLGGYLLQPESVGLDVLVRVSRLPILAGVPPAALELAASRLVPVPVTAGEVVIRQGDAPDRFYIIESGSFAVDQAGADGGEPVRLRVLGVDQVFGELGLMNGAPRSATVSAETDGRLLALSGPDFLELANSAAEVSSRLANLYRGPGTSSS
jgi:MFS family permease